MNGMTIVGLLVGSVVGYVVWRVCVLMFNWLRWMYRRRKYYGDVPLLSGTWWPLRFGESDLQRTYDQIVAELADADSGALPRCWDRGFFGSGTNSIVLVKPDDLRHVMNNTQLFPKPPELLFIVGTMLGNEYSLVLSEGETWRRQRKMLTPVFHARSLLSLVDEMQRQTVHTVGELLAARSPEALAADWRLPVAGYANPVPLFERLTLKIILAGCFGADLDIEEMGRRWSAVAHAFFGYAIGRFLLGTAFDHMPFPSARTMTGQIAKIRAHIRRLIAKRRQHLIDSQDDNPTAVVDLLGLMMLQRDESGQMLSDEELVSQSLTIMFAGHETTSSALSWCAYYLSLRPDVQERCFAEIAAFRRRGAPLTTEQLRSQFPLIAAVFNESLRMVPPAPQLTREVLHDTVFPSGVRVMAGDRVVIGIYQSCMDGEHWPQPRLWNPDRWLDADMEQRKPLFPVFLTGARNCLGERFARLEAVVALVLLIEKFRFEIDPDCAATVVRKSVVTTQPHNLRIRFVQRLSL